MQTIVGSVAKNLAILQNQRKTSQIGYLYAINRSIMIQKAIVIAQKGSKIIFATEPSSATSSLVLVPSDNSLAASFRLGVQLKT